MRTIHLFPTIDRFTAGVAATRAPYYGSQGWVSPFRELPPERHWTFSHPGGELQSHSSESQQPVAALELCPSRTPVPPSLEATRVPEPEVPMQRQPETPAKAHHPKGLIVARLHN